MINSCSNNDLWQILSALAVFLLGAGIILTTAGAARFKNSVSILFQGFLLLVITIGIWQVAPLSVVFPVTSGTSCESLVKYLFQGSFLFVALCSFLGATVERARTSTLIFFFIYWSFAVYLPIAYWVWNPDGFLYELGIRDFAGSLVVHLSCGISALAYSLALGRRLDFFNLRKPSNIWFIFLGNLLIWLGWLGFNAGSIGAFSPAALVIAERTLISGVAGVLTWSVLERLHPPHRMHFLHYTFALVSALVSTTAHIDKLNSTQVSLIASVTVLIAFYSVRFMNKVVKIDDVMEVFSSHAIASACGAMMGAALNSNHPTPINVELIGILAVGLYSFVISYIPLTYLNKLGLLRVSPAQETSGLDLSLHGEQVVDRD